MDSATGARLAFPDGFLWGTATSSHQVEGGNTNNDWWAWERQSGHISDGSSSGQACDWWHIAEADLDLAAQLGQNAHRLSVEWSRLEPREGAWDETAVERYRVILEHMLRIGLRPMLTLHHFTLPVWLAERGGWQNDRTVEWFARYVARCADAFHDLVDLWCTLNEPMVQLAFGHLTRAWPPGSGGWRAVGRGLEHMASAHARAYDILHTAQARAQVGYAKHVRVFDAADLHNPLDRLAARGLDWLFNGAELHALATGATLPPYGWHVGGRCATRFLDYVGVNYYSRDMVAFDLKGQVGLPVRRFANPDAPFSMEGWGEIYADGLYRTLVQMSSLGLPIYVTEFGVPDRDDSLRPRFIVEHVGAMYRALQEDVPLRGAFFWSLVDNFEWAEGWRAPFGLISTDRETQRRAVKPSAEVYGRIAQSNGLLRALVREVAPESESRLFVRQDVGS